MGMALVQILAEFERDKTVEKELAYHDNLYFSAYRCDRL